MRPNWPRIIAWSHLLGGILGLSLLVFTPVPRGRLTLPDIWVIGSLALFGLSVASGISNLRRRPSGPRLMATVELLQLFQFHTGTFAYVYMSGIQVLFVLSTTTVSLSPGVRSAFWLGGGTTASAPYLAIDLFSFFAFWALWRARRAPLATMSTASDAPPA